MSAALLIAAKDARERLRDRSLLLFALVLPLALAYVFSLILGGSGGGPELFRYGVLDSDRGEVAATFTDEVLPAVADGGVIAVRPVASLDEARDLVDGSDLAAVFVVPAGFSTAVQSGRPAQIEIIGDVDSALGVQVARAIAESFTAELNAVRLSVAAASASGAPVDAEALVARAMAAANPVTLTDAATGDRELDVKTYLSASMAVFFLFFTVQFGVLSLLDERRTGTMARLLAAPISRGSILAAKLLVTFGIGVLSMGALAVATSLLLGARWGNPVGVAILVVAGVAAATGVMALVASLARTVEQASNWQAIIAVVLGVFGGVFFPISQVGGALATLSYATPHRWFLQGLADLTGGGGLGVVVAPTLAMLAFAVAAGSVAAFRIGRVVQP